MTMQDVKDWPPSKLLGGRQILAERWDEVKFGERRLSRQETAEVLEIAITALDALVRVDNLAEELMQTPEGPAAPVARAFGGEIRRAVQNKR